MLGCMEETSVAIAAAAALAGLADWVDLDGNLLLARDPYEGLVLGDDKRWQLGEFGRPGGPSPPRLSPADGLWTRSWTSRWMACLPLSSHSAYHRRSTT